MNKKAIVLSGVIALVIAFIFKDKISEIIKGATGGTGSTDDSALGGMLETSFGTLSGGIDSGSTSMTRGTGTPKITAQIGTKEYYRQKFPISPNMTETEVRAVMTQRIKAEEFDKARLGGIRR